MALRGTNGIYYRILPDSFSGRSMAIEKWPSEAVRRNGPANEFEEPRLVSHTCGPELDAELAKTADGKKSIRDNITAALYCALKADSRSAGMEDC